MELYDIKEVDSDEEDYEEVESEEEEATEEEDESDDEDLFNKNTASFRCLAQVLLSSSSLMRNALYHFPPLDDPGLDETFDYVEPDQVFDDIGAEKYVRLCKELEIVPISRVVRSLPTKELNLRYYGLTLKQIKAITSSLQLNCHVEYLILEDNVMNPDAVDYVSQMLTENNTIIHLNMKECRIGPKGAAKLCEGIETTQSMKELDLSFNSLGNEGLAALSIGFIRNQSIKKLSLSRNQLSEECSKTLAKIVSENQLIEELDLSLNEFYTQIGLKNLCEGLTKNLSIRALNLSWNGMGLVKEAMIPMVKYLKACETLEHLDLSNNRIGGVTLRMVKAGVGASASLKWVSLCNNIIKPDEAMFVSRLLTDPELPLTEIHLDCFVEKGFRQLSRRIKKLGKTVKIEGFLSDYMIRGPDDKKLLFERIRYVCQKAKKKKLKKDFGLFLFTLPDQSMTKDDFVKSLKKFKLRKIVKDKDMLEYLVKKFPDKNNVDCREMRRLYLDYYPDTLPPPPKKRKKKKGRRGKKGKKKHVKIVEAPAAVASSTVVESSVTAPEVTSSREAIPTETETALTESEVAPTSEENTEREATVEETIEHPSETTEGPTETIENPPEIENPTETTEIATETREKSTETVDIPTETVENHENVFENETHTIDENKTQSQEETGENIPEINNETVQDIVETNLETAEHVVREEETIE